PLVWRHVPCGPATPSTSSWGCVRLRLKRILMTPRLLCRSRSTVQSLGADRHSSGTAVRRGGRFHGVRIERIHSRISPPPASRRLDAFGFREEGAGPTFRFVSTAPSIDDPSVRALLRNLLPKDESEE